MSEMSRRKALTLLGAGPVAAALHVSPLAGELAALAEVREIATDGRAEAAERAKRRGDFTPEFFTSAEWRTVSTLVDLIIPGDDRSGSATDAAVPEFMDFTLIDRPTMQTRMRGGLRWLDNESRSRFGRPFVDARESEQKAILDDIAYPDQARPEMSHGVAFFSYIRDFTASGFFSSRMGVEDLRYTGNRALGEWTGCPPEALDRLGVSYDVMNGP